MTQWRTLCTEIKIIPLPLRKSLNDEFSKGHSRWSAVTRNIIQDIFVNLMTQKKAADKYKTHKQTVSRAVKVLSVFLKAKKIIKK